MIQRLLSFLLDTSFEDLTPEIIFQAKRCMVDWIGVTLGGLNHSSISILIQTIKELGGRSQATILGTPIKTSMLHAALVNGAMSHVLDFDDTHLPALMHPSAPLLPALFAYGEWKKANGKDILLAFVLGFEVETRISMAMGTSHYDAGWHSTATMGRFGAAAGVGKLAGLDRQKMAYALGLAGTQASGIRRVFGTMAKSFHPGKAASDGLLSVLLAQKGYTSPTDILEGEKGLGSLLSSDFDPQRGLEGLGKSYTIMGTSFKPYSSCLYTHPAIYGVIQLRNQHQIDPLDVEAIHCSVSKFCFDAACIREPQTGLEGKFSTPFCIALALIEGNAGEDLFKDEATKDPAIRDVMRRVKVEEKSDLSDKEAELTIWLHDGRTMKHKVDYPLGDPQNPLTDKQLEGKARNLLKSVFEKEIVEAVLKKLWDLESIENIEELISLLREGSRRKKMDKDLKRRIQNEKL